MGAKIGSFSGQLNFRPTLLFVRLKLKNIHLTVFVSNHHNYVHHISVIFSETLNV
jgi:hypothetical protein